MKMIIKSIFKSFVILVLFYLAFILISPGNMPFFSKSLFTDLGMLSFFFFILQFLILYYFH